MSPEALEVFLMVSYSCVLSSTAFSYNTFMFINFQSFLISYLIFPETILIRQVLKQREHLKLTKYDLFPVKLLNMGMVINVLQN
jgi:hypothetical protein